MIESIANPYLLVGISLLKGSAESTLVTDGDTGTVLHVNPAFERLAKRPAAELSGWPLNDLGLWTNPALGRQLAGRLAQGESVKDAAMLVQVAGGKPLLANVNATSLALGSARCHVYHLQALEGPAQDQAELSAILDTALVGIAFNRTDPKPRHFIHCNPAFETMFGWPRGELIGKATSSIWPSQEAYTLALAESEAALTRGEAIEIERPLLRRDGSVFVCQVRAKMVGMDGVRPEGTVMIFEDLTQRHAQDAALAAAMQVAVNANLAKSAFVANLSHEIRNPLGALLGLAHLVNLPDCDEQQRVQYLRQILASALMLKDLLDNTLDFSKIEAGMLTMTRRPFDVQALLTELTTAWHLVASDRGLTLASLLEAGAPLWLVGDAIRVRQILSNFVSNALKFTDHGEVQLRYGRADEARVRFQVIDQGPGIGADLQSQLFQRFVQLEETVTVRKTTGTGLGLSICRDLAHHMGGQVGVDSAPGQGSCFWLELPLLSAPTPATEAALSASPAGLNNGQELAGVRLLVVEDDPVNQLITRAFLERWGGRVEVVGDGETGAQQLLAAQAAGQSFDFVLMDLHMAGWSGIETTLAIRQHRQVDAVVIIGLSAATEQQEIADALQSGMAEVISKPFEPGHLCSRLQLHWQARQRASSPTGVTGQAPH